MKVSRLGIGGVSFGAWGETDHEKAVGVIRAAIAGGINLIDTSDAYSQGESEEIIGKALAGGRRDGVILATKFHMPGDVRWDEPGGDPNKRGNGRRWLIEAVEASLRRLQTDWIDLYQAHQPEPGTDFEETLSALTDLRTAGKIRAFGTSNFAAHELVESQWTAERRALGRFVSEQAPYSMVVRSIEQDVIPVAERHRLALLPWSPLAGGWLSGRYRKGGEIPQSSRKELMPERYNMELAENQAKLDVVDQLGQLADEAGITLVHMSLAFLLAQPVVTAPLIGPRTLDQLETQLGAVDVRLSQDVLDRIDEIVPRGVTVAPNDLH